MPVLRRSSRQTSSPKEWTASAKASLIASASFSDGDDGTEICIRHSSKNTTAPLPYRVEESRERAGSEWDSFPKAFVTPPQTGHTATHAFNG